MSRVKTLFKVAATLHKHIQAKRKQQNIWSPSSHLTLSLVSKRDHLHFVTQFVRHFSSDTKSKDLNSEHADDPEVRAWVNQIAQDFEKGKEPFPVEKVPPKSEKSNSAKAKETQPTQFQFAAPPEIEEFGYFDDEQEISEVTPHKLISISLERGQQGVFDVEEIVKVLKDENGIDVRVLDIPPVVRFVDHMVIVSGKSLRHMRAMAATIESLYKKKQLNSDRTFRLEGRECKDWFAMDLGNIAVHIFMPEARQHYDLETLWTLGPEQDDRRHYIQDQHLNLTAEELFWLESELKPSPSKDVPK